jgi:hypothetical protein
MPGLVPGIHVFAAAARNLEIARCAIAHLRFTLRVPRNDVARHFRDRGGMANCSVRSRSVMSMTVTIGAVSS